MSPDGRRQHDGSRGVRGPLEGGLLQLTPGVMTRPMADGILVAIDDRQPIALYGIQERCLAVCVRTTSWLDLVEQVSAVSGGDRSSVETAVDELIAHRLLTVVPSS